MEALSIVIASKEDKVRARLIVIFGIFAAVLLVSGCGGDSGSDGADGADGTDGTDGTDGATIELPTLEGHNGNHGYLLAYDVQAAYNDDTFFWQVSYRGNEGKRHQYLRYTDGAWQKEGGDRRDAQASIDGDVDQGDQGQLSTIYEQRTTIMVNDPGADTAVPNFDKFGCFLSCHNDARHMPEWTSANGHDGKYIPIDDANPGASDGDVALDLWHWRGARSNPIGMADDQNIRTLDWAGSTSSGDDGGRKGDAGQSVFLNQGITDGNPDYLLDPGTTWGEYTFAWDDFWLTPFYYMTLPDAEQLGPMAPNPVAIEWADVSGSFAAIEGDTVPRRILRAGLGSRADITAHGTKFVSDTPDGSLGTWQVQMQRDIDTENGDDIAFVEDQQYDVGFEVHLWEYTTRDHYVSFPVTMGVGNGAPASDIIATDISSTNPLGKFPLPEWADIPKVRVWLFQPGINTWEFVNGTNAADGKVYTDPVTGNPVDQVHGGAGAVASGTACVSCHAVRTADLTGGQFGGSMEDITKQRGGIWADTPTD